MLESILVRRAGDTGASVDKGLLAEALLFYGVVHVHFDRSSLVSLCREIGTDNLLRLLQSGRMRGTYIPHLLGTHTASRDGIDTHNFLAMEVVGHANRPKQSRREILQEVLERQFGQSWGIKKFTKKFLDLVPVKENLGVESDNVSLGDMALADMEDQNFTMFSVEKRIQQEISDFSLPPDAFFRPIRQKDGFFIDTNIDFQKITKTLKEQRPEADFAITPALCAGIVHEARADIQLASQYGSELLTSPAMSEILSKRINTILSSRIRSSRQIEAFQESVLQSSRAVGDVLRRGDRTFDEFMILLEKSEKFREWLRSANPDAGLVSEYLRAVESDTWLEKLPAKSSRFMFFTGAGLAVDAALPTGIGTVAGVAIGAADALVLDRLLKGWRPNQFVEKRLGPFVRR